MEAQERDLIRRAIVQIVAHTPAQTLAATYPREQLLQFKRELLTLARADGVRGRDAREARELAYGLLTDALARQWGNARDLTPAHGHVCIFKLLGKRCDYGASHACTPPSGDHMSLWNRGGRAVVFVSQPYGWDAGRDRVTRAYCAAHGLTFKASPIGSWHCPEDEQGEASRGTWLITYERATAQERR